MGERGLSGNRDFRLLWIGGLLSGFGSQLAALAVPLLILEQTGSPARAGLVASVSAGVLLVSLIPCGALADVVERRRLMIVSELISVGASAALTIGVHVGWSPLPLVLVVAVVGPVLNSLYLPAASALLTVVVPEHQRGLAISQLQARSAAVRLVGPLLGGTLFAWSPALPFAAESVGLAASALCLLAVRARAKPTTRAAAAFTRPHLTGGIRFLWRQPFLRTTVLVLSAGMNAAFGGVMTAAIAASALRDPSGRSSAIIMTASAAGSLTGALVAGPLHASRNPRAALLLTGWTAAGAVTVMTFAPGTWSTAAMVGMCLLAGGIGSVAFVTVMLSLTPTDLIGRVQSAATLTSMLCQPVGPLAGGLLLEHFGHRPTFAVFAAVTAGCAVAVTVVHPPDEPAAARLPEHEADPVRTS